ncbi:MAG: Cys-Gln thioester bond-forming surface protein [Lachnospiraceae bacterium]|nr:Cys-Gln thioester bond-forming surface protein [Lachnospiraceae bacterium]
MRRRGKKLLAWLMTFSMVSSIVTFPASAEVPTPENTTTTTTTSEIKNEDNEVIGTVTTTVTETKTEDVTEKKEESSWSSVDTNETPGTPQVNGNTTTTVENETTTSVTGTETTTDKVEDKTNSTEYSGTTSGSESTTVVDKTTTTVVEKDELYSDVDGETKPTVENQTEMEKEFGGDKAITDSEWKQEENGFKEGSYGKVEGSESSTSGTNSDMVLDDTYTGNIMINVPNDTDGKEGNEFNTGSTTVEISIKDALKNDIAYTTEGTQADGSVVTFIKDAAGNVIGYKVKTYSNEEKKDPSEIEPGETSATHYSNSEPKTENVKPDGYEVGTTPILDNDNKEIGSKKIEEIKDDDGNVIGYRITETKIVGTKEATGESTTKPGAAQTPTVKLPEKPIAPAPVTKDGLTTTVTVEDIYENGNLVGYKTITRVTDADGKEVSKTSDSIYQTVTTYETTVTKDPQTEVETLTTVTEILGLKETQTYTATTQGTQTTDSFRDVTEEVYQLVETEDGMFFLYEGKLYEVVGTNTVTHSNLTGANNVNTDQYGKNKADDNDDLRLWYERLNAESMYNDNYTGNNALNDNFTSGEAGKWDYNGFGMVSDFEVYETEMTKGKYKDHRVRLFRVQNGNEIRYAYCVELGADLKSGVNYGSNTYERDNTTHDSSEPWEGATGTIKQLRSVALNGFWGTDSGLGSLQAVKDLMIRNGLKEEAENLTAGMALTATQVAIWQFGSNDSSVFGKVGATDEETIEFAIKKFGTNIEIDDEKAETINKLRNLLVRLADNANGEGQATVITKDNAFAEAGFVVHDKVDVEVSRDDNDDNDVYNTDILFKLGVSTSSINGDLIIKVLDNEGNAIKSYRLAGEDGEKSIFDGVFSKIYPNADGVYKMEGIPLAENVKVSLALEGIQHLDDGVYVFYDNSADDWQDFISLSRLDNTVDLKMDMEFKVTDPTAQIGHTTNKWQEKKTDTQSYTKTDTYEEYRLGTNSNAKETLNTKVYGVTTTVTVETKTTESESEWNSNYNRVENHQNNNNNNNGGGNNGGGSNKPVVISDNDVPLFAGDTIEISDSNVPLSDGVLNIEDDPVPLAVLPMTGDVSAIWMLISLISGLGLAGLSLADRKKCR